MTSTLRESNKIDQLAGVGLQAKKFTFRCFSFCDYKIGMISSHSLLILRNKGKRTV